jgi:hypothetical protein
LSSSSNTPLHSGSMLSSAKPLISSSRKVKSRVKFFFGTFG